MGGRWNGLHDNSRGSRKTCAKAIADDAQLPLGWASQRAALITGETPGSLIISPLVADVFKGFYNPDGDQLTIGASGQRFVYVFQLITYQPLLVFHNHSSWCCKENSSAFSDFEE